MRHTAHRLRIPRRGTRSGGRSSSLPDLELNLSFVLHERSMSDSVRRVAQASRQHAERTNSAAPLDHVDITLDGQPFSPDVWISATLGYPGLLPDALSHLGSEATEIVMIDRKQGDVERVFFRAPASLRIDDTSAAMAGVAALVARPANAGAQLILRGPFELPDDLPLALRQLESLIQSYADQWMPPRALWNAPAEVLLGDEIR